MLSPLIQKLIPISNYGISHKYIKRRKGLRIFGIVSISFEYSFQAYEKVSEKSNRDNQELFEITSTDEETAIVRGSMFYYSSIQNWKNLME